MKKNIIVVLVCMVVMLVALACQITAAEPDENEVATAAAQTIEAKYPPTEEPTAGPPTVTPLPTYTVVVPPTPEPKPCNKAKFISETVPDGTEFSPDEEFTKTWRLENIGTCTWNTNYRVALQSGDSMGMDGSQHFTQIIKPGEYMDVVLELEAPSDEDDYTTWFQLQDDSGKKFAQLSVQIEVK
jgi:hypothetical protein